jgi:hypothetical protein
MIYNQQENKILLAKIIKFCNDSNSKDTIIDVILRSEQKSRHFITNFFYT